MVISTLREYSKLKGSQAAKVTKASMANIRKICASKNKWRWSINPDYTQACNI